MLTYRSVMEVPSDVPIERIVGSEVKGLVSVWLTLPVSGSQAAWAVVL